MSNDVKLWITRFILLALASFDLLLILILMPAAMSPSRPHLWLIASLLVLSILASLAVSVYYYYQKARRWESSYKDQGQIAIETLAEAGLVARQERSQKDNNLGLKPIYPDDQPSNSERPKS